MEWLIVQMWLWLALAALLGLVIGCWICSREAPNLSGDLDVEVARLRSRCEETDAEKFHLRAKVAELEAELAMGVVLTSPNPTFYEAPSDGDPDDLKAIKGIGAKLETMLHSIGVYYFDQIANWDDNQVAEVDDKLAFKGRIHRDEWRSQAKALGKSHTGQRLFSKGS